MPLRIAELQDANYAFMVFPFPNERVCLRLLKGPFTKEDFASYFAEQINGKCDVIDAQLAQRRLKLREFRQLFGLSVADRMFWACRNCGNFGQAAKYCERCRFVHYCDRRCQLRDWKRHMTECASIAGAYGPRAGRFPDKAQCPVRLASMFSAYDYHLFRHLLKQNNNEKQQTQQKKCRKGQQSFTVLFYRGLAILHQQ